MLSLIFLTFAAISACSGQFLNCNWVSSLNCSKYPDAPECGTDGVDYRNRCEFAKAQCANKDLHIFSIGTCASNNFVPTTTLNPAATTKPTAAITKPTAANTAAPTPGMTQPTGAGVTTTMSATTPTKPTTTMPAGPTTTHAPVFLGHNAVLDFFCLELSREVCPTDTEQVCGTDNKTYANFCEYEKARCTHRDLNVVHYGSC